MSAFERLMKFAKLTTLFSFGVTILAVMAIAGLELTAWIENGVWKAYRLSSVLESLKGNHPTIYVTASAETQYDELGVAALHLVFYQYLSVLEKRLRVRNRMVRQMS